MQIIAFLICLSQPGHCEAALLFLPRASAGWFSIPRLPLWALLRIPPNLGLLCFRPWSPGFSRRPRSLPPSQGEPGAGRWRGSRHHGNQRGRAAPLRGGLSLFSAAGVEPEPSARAKRPASWEPAVGAPLCSVFLLLLCAASARAPGLPGGPGLRRKPSCGPGKLLQAEAKYSDPRTPATTGV